jgi:hypothetical protein
MLVKNPQTGDFMAKIGYKFDMDTKYASDKQWQWNYYGNLMPL